ncbi:MAG: nuclear transport factor 2 family protein [Acidobacteriota bacterium]
MLMAMDESLDDTLLDPAAPKNLKPAEPTITEIADTYLEAYRFKDPNKALLSPEVTLEYPLAPRKILGKAQVIEYMLSVMPAFDDVELVRHVTEGEFVATIWNAHTAWGLIPACTVFRILKGQIVEVRSFFDPRPIVDPA